MNKYSTFKQRFYEISYIVYKNAVLLTNGIILAVVALLYIFGDTKAALFIGLIFFLSMAIGIAQDLRAWFVLQKLQSLTAPKVWRLNSDGTAEAIFAEQIKKDDLIKLKIGDQVLCDGRLIEARNFEINQGLITGESDSFSKTEGERLLAGSVVTAGSGLMKSESIFGESRIARMIAGAKAYSASASPIQKSVGTFIKYSSYAAVAAMAFVVIRGILVHEPILRMIKVIGAIASMFVPQGLVFAMTIFFAYGAARLFQKHVLLQEVNATEKLGRIKNLCLDKTGTLTKNELIVEEMYLPSAMDKDRAEKLASAYISGSGDSSDIIQAVKEFLKRDYAGEILESLAFSSWRKFGAVSVKNGEGEGVVLAGLPDYFMERISSAQERQWLKKIIDSQTSLGKRVFCFAWTDETGLPKDISRARLSVIALVVLSSALREGIQDTIDFFQNRGVHIRIISGDNAQTARAIATVAGINDSAKLITGKEISDWTEADFERQVGSFAVFAEIVPEQKEKIIAAFKKTGFTAMVGDGANDALAIKQADLGIAMFDGAAATRHLASVVLTDNSFTSLPGGVALADGLIRNIEIYGSVFINMTLMGIFFYAIMAVFGYEYPLTPLNITLINYFTIGFPGILLFYWTIRPSGMVQPADERSFLNRVLPFSAVSALVQAFGAAIIFVLSPQFLKISESNTFVVLSFIAFGFLLFILAPGVYRGALTRPQKIQLLILGAVETFLLAGVFYSPFLMSFFNIAPLNLPLIKISQFALVAAVVGYIQYRIMKKFISNSL